MDCSLPGFFIHGIFQTSILECISISYSSICIHTHTHIYIHTHAHVYILIMPQNQLNNLELVVKLGGECFWWYGVTGVIVVRNCAKMMPQSLWNVFCSFCPCYPDHCSCHHHIMVQFSSVQFSRSVISDSLWPHESQHARPPCASPTPGVHSDSCPSSQWCHPAISSSVIPFSSCPQSLPASGSFPVSQLFA